MNKKIIVVSLLLITVFSFTVGCSKKSEINTGNLNTIDKSDINPISKETAINILKAEYGDNIIIEDKDIKLIGDLYFIDIYVEVEEENDEGHETHIHKQRLGTQKIDKYTGELITE